MRPPALLASFKSGFRQLACSPAIAGLQFLQNMAQVIRHRDPDARCRIPRRFSVSILEEGGHLGLKCLLLSYFRVGDRNPQDWAERRWKHALARSHQ